ncbi:IS1096 element passenger TnpR family protein [Agrobacterium larrymoorei]|uniref:Plasmid pRiA4b ORF-3 family protein n=1 Tax=Agrobacterium larrymoorei TaxID=160699 RepID=A0A4D7E1Y6_9HYPH|nr:plasmid pRiA4b ORF-3 family protein [Agrobacterium larrymoorei]QYA10400.1 hypothetical protein J5285_22270 [Agrobacterium larrymoorei]
MQQKIFPATAGFDDPFLLEAVGGPWGYEEFREALSDVNIEQHRELLEWWASSDYDPSQVDAINLGKNVEALAAKWKRRSRKKA